VVKVQQDAGNGVPTPTENYLKRSTTPDIPWTQRNAIGWNMDWLYAVIMPDASWKHLAFRNASQSDRAKYWPHPNWEYSGTRTLPEQPLAVGPSAGSTTTQQGPNPESTVPRL